MYYPVAEVQEMINVCESSGEYGRPFGIRLIFKNGQQKSFAGQPEYALCYILTKKQRKEIERICHTIESAEVYKITHTE